MNEIQKIISDAIFALYNIKVENIETSTPPKIELGDVCYGPFLLARDLQKSPAQISTELLEEVKKNPLIESANVAGPYLNLKISSNMIKNTFLELYKNQANVEPIGN
jgi:arginyl-tRNA synthetase